MKQPIYEAPFDKFDFEKTARIIKWFLPREPVTAESLKQDAINLLQTCPHIAEGDSVKAGIAIAMVNGELMVSLRGAWKSISIERLRSAWEADFVENMIPSGC